MKNLNKNYIESQFPKFLKEEFKEEVPTYPSEVPATSFEKKREVDSTPTVIEEIEEESEYEEEITTLKVTPSAETDRVVVDTNTHERLSKLEGSKVRFVDFYRDARTFLEKANSTKFVLVSYILLTSPLLLMGGFLSEDVYREILIIISLTYLGVDAYEKRSLVRKK